MSTSETPSLGGYRLIRLLGEGGMGQVWLAEHPRLPRRVAVKVLRAGTTDAPDARQRFLREAETAARLEHPCIIDVFDRGEDDGRLWIAMRFVEGEDLSARIAAAGAVPLDQTMVIARAVAEALDHAHARGVVHRDIKPANILLPLSGQPPAVVTDFGIARALDDSTTVTGTGLLIGSMSYISPEQIDGAPTGPSSDLYAFGCTLFEALSGVRAFNGPTTSSIIGAHVAPVRPSIRAVNPALPAAIEPVMQRALALDPRDRWPSAGQFVDALQAALDPSAATVITALPPRPSATSQTITAARPDPTPAVPFERGATHEPKRRVAPPWIAAGAAVALAAASLVGWQLSRNGSSSANTLATSTTSGSPGASSPAVNPTSPSSTTSSATPTTAQTPTSTTQSSSTQSSAARPAGDLGLAAPITTPACDGRGIIIMYNAVTNSVASQRQQIRDALARWPQASYFKPSADCSSVRSVKDGQQIYAVYLDEGVLDEVGLCQALLPYATSAASSPYAKYLDNTHPIGHFYRWDATRTHCYYETDASGTDRRAVI